MSSYRSTDGDITNVSCVGAVDLYWIPRGAGGHVVRVSGKLFEVVEPQSATPWLA